MQLKQVYHHWNLWEDHKHGFYNNCSGEEKKKKKKLVEEMFNSKEETERCMIHVVENWRFSMEHNLTNPSINKIAYIGQCACCYYAGIPNTITMEVWGTLPQEVRERSDMIAKKAIEHWKKTNKYIQTCLSLD